jgi:RNA polymerase sigma-70 factor (ECF subfamily)
MHSVDKPAKTSNNACVAQELRNNGNKKAFYSLSMTDDRQKQAEEKQLIERSVEGESSAFGSLYDRYLPKIYRFVFFKVGHREEAEDLTQQIFMSAWENISAFQEQGLPISSWLYKIARNRVIDHYRTKKTHVPLDVVPEEVAQLAEELEETDKKLLLERIYSSLHKLTDDQQEIIVLRFIEELTNREIADVLEKNEIAVRVLQHRAIKNLKKILEP